MKDINRVLAVCNDFGKCEAVLSKSVEIAKNHNAGLTVMFVIEESLFALPFFDEDENAKVEKLRTELKAKLQDRQMENAALFIYVNDTVDRVALEAEREEDSLIVTHYAEGISADIARKTKRAVLVLKESSHNYATVVMAMDAVLDVYCLEYCRKLFPGVALTLYQDFQYVPMPAVDPTFEPIDVTMDATLYTELLEARRETFQAFCKEQGVEGVFEIGENGIAEDTVAFAQKREADLLVIAALDEDTMLGDVVADIVERSTIDTMICFVR